MGRKWEALKKSLLFKRVLAPTTKRVLERETGPREEASGASHPVELCGWDARGRRVDGDECLRISATERHRAYAAKDAAQNRGKGSSESIIHTIPAQLERTQRRCDRRVPLNTTAWIRRQDKAPLPTAVRLLNISAGGVLLVSPRGLHSGDCLDLSFILPRLSSADFSFRARAEVRHVESHPDVHDVGLFHVGLRFIEVSPENVHPLRLFLALANLRSQGG